MPWRRKEPGHKQPWYLLCSTEFILAPHLKGFMMIRYNVLNLSIDSVTKSHRIYWKISPIFETLCNLMGKDTLEKISVILFSKLCLLMAWLCWVLKHVHGHEWAGSSSLYLRGSQGHLFNPIGNRYFDLFVHIRRNIYCVIVLYSDTSFKIQYF